MEIERFRLLPCPFCGGSAMLCGDFDIKHYVACTTPDCFCAVGEGYDRDTMPDHSFHTDEEAAAAWNTRISPKQNRPS